MVAMAAIAKSYQDKKREIKLDRETNVERMKSNKDKGVSVYTGKNISSYCLSKWQLLVQPMMKISSIWPHFCFSAGIILCMGPANEGRRYIVTLSLIGWTHTQNDPCQCIWNHHGDAALLDAFYNVFMSSIIQISWKYLFLWHENNDQIISQVCTYHDSWATMTYGKFWHDWIIRIKIRTEVIITRFVLWAHKQFVQWYLGVQQGNVLLAM